MPSLEVSAERVLCRVSQNFKLDVLLQLPQNLLGRSLIFSVSALHHYQPEVTLKFLNRFGISTKAELSQNTLKALDCQDILVSLGGSTSLSLELEILDTDNRVNQMAEILINHCYVV